MGLGMLDPGDEFDGAMIVLRNTIGFLCCAIAGGLVALIHEGWIPLLVMLLAFWPLVLAIDLGARREWHARAHATLARLKIERAADIAICALVIGAPLVATSAFELDLGPAALLFVLAGAVAALWFDLAAQAVCTALALAVFDFAVLPPDNSFLITNLHDGGKFVLVAVAMVVMGLGARAQASLSSYYE